MRYLFTAEDEAFRSEVREFLRRELGSDWTGSVTELQPDEFDFDIHMRRRLAEKGWLTQAWPKEYGGEGASVSRQMVLNEEIGYHHSPGKDGQGIVMIGPCIMIHGTQEQKKEHLPRIAGGARSSGARGSASQALVRTWRRSRPARSATATTMSSTGPRCGPPTRTAPTGCTS